MKKVLITRISFLYFIISTLVKAYDENWDAILSNALRVTNGSPARLGDVPYQVSFKLRSELNYIGFCGGVILSPTKVLTAAHCFANRNNFFVAVFQGRFSTTNIKRVMAVAGQVQTIVSVTESKQGQWRNLLNLTFPYSFNFPRHDIAIVFVTEPWTFNAQVNSIEYASRYIDYRGSALISGHGRTAANVLNRSHVLLLGTTTLVASDRCTRLHHRNMRRYICTTEYPSAIEAGDSGGPLVCKGTADPNERSRGILVGITCGAFGRNPFFTRVSPYYSYIEKNHSISSKDSPLSLICALYLIHSFSFMYNIPYFAS